MYRIELARGEVTVFRTIEELAIGVRNGVITTRARIYHNASQKWLPIEFHPHYKKALELLATPGADLAAPKAPERRSGESPTYTFAQAVHASMAHAAADPAPEVHRPAPHDPGSPAPESQPPRVQGPTDHAPAGSARGADARAVQVPAGHVPVNDAPTAQAPVVHVPVAHAPVVHSPAAHAPMAHAPAMVAEPPREKAPVARRSVRHEPIFHRPVHEEPAVHQPASSHAFDLPAAVASPVLDLPKISYPEITPAEAPVARARSASRSRRPLHLAGLALVLTAGGYLGMSAFAPARGSGPHVPAERVADLPATRDEGARPAAPTGAASKAAAVPALSRRAAVPAAVPAPAKALPPASSGFAPALEPRALATGPAPSGPAARPIDAPADSLAAVAPAIELDLAVPELQGADSLSALPRSRSDSAMKRILRAVNGGKDLPQHP